jgi:hypothetical protein
VTGGASGAVGTPSPAPRIVPNARTRSGFVSVNHAATATPTASQMSATHGAYLSIAV